MKKLFAFLLVSTMFISLTYSQENKFSVGVKGGLSISKLDIKHNDSDAKLGYRFGVTGEYKLENNFFIQSGLDLVSKGTKNKSYEEGDVDGDGLFGDYLHTKLTCNAVYLELPILAGYDVNVTDNLKIRFMAGPYLSYGVGGKVKAEGYGQFMQPSGIPAEFSEKDKSNTFSSESLKRFDMGLLGAVGAEYNKFQLTVGYEYGLLNISQGRNSAHNMNGFVTLGYRIF